MEVFVSRDGNKVHTHTYIIYIDSINRMVIGMAIGRLNGTWHSGVVTKRIVTAYEFGFGDKALPSKSKPKCMSCYNFFCWSDE